MSKKVLLAVAVLALLVVGAVAYAAQDVSVYIDGTKLDTDVPPVIVSGRTLVPMRAIFQALGATVSWDEATQTVTAVKGNTVISLVIGSLQARLGSQEVSLDVPAQLVKGRTMVPGRFVSQALGASVEWNESSRTVTITTGSRAAAPGYAGNDACLSCHPDQYNQFRAAGHQWKLRPAAEAKANPLPLPKGYTWDDISYVIGGYKWKARYVGNDGYIITATKSGEPGKNQYNLATGTWSDYHPGEKKA